MILPLRYRLVSNFCRGVHWVTTRGTVTCPKPHDKGVNRAQTKSRPVCTFPPHTPSPVPPTLCCFEVVKTIKKCFQKAFSLWYNNPTLKMYPIDYSHMYEMIIFKVFHGSSVYIRKRLKQLKCSSTRGWLNKLWHITSNGISYSSKQEWRSSLCTDTKTKTKLQDKLFSKKNPKCKTTYKYATICVRKIRIYICIYIYLLCVCINTRRGGQMRTQVEGRKILSEYYYFFKYCFDLSTICRKLRQLRKKGIKRQLSRAMNLCTNLLLGLQK